MNREAVRLISALDDLRGFMQREGVQVPRILPPPPAPPGVPRPDDLDAGIRASLAGRRPEDSSDEEDQEDQHPDAGELSLYRRTIHGHLHAQPRPGDGPPMHAGQPRHTSEGLVLLTEESLWLDPRDLGDKARVKLHSHQLAELREMVRREVDGDIRFVLPGNGAARLASSVGILGDLPGYGKTTTMLALACLSHRVRREVEAGVSLGAAGVLTVTREAGFRRKKFWEPGSLLPEQPDEVESTLILCPSKLLKHWAAEAAAKFPGLRVLVYKKLGKFLSPQDVASVDVVLAPPSAVDGCSRLRWKRLIVDEADTVKLPGREIPLMCLFVWLITASYDALAQKHSGWIHGELLHAFLPSRGKMTANRPFINRLIVRGEDGFVVSSSGTPPIDDETIICTTPAIVKASREFINAEVAEMLASGDVEKAIVALGGKARNETDVMGLIKANTERDLGNERLERDHVLSLDIEADARASRLKRAELRIASLESRLVEIAKSIAEIGTSECKICYTALESPTILLCCSNIFCGRCLLGWFNQWLKSTCPMCRQKVDIKRQMVAVTPEVIEGDTYTKDPLTKNAALLTICRQRKAVLVFANHEGALSLILEVLKKGGVDADLYSGRNTTCIDRFRASELRVLVVDPRATAGIAIPEATTIVLYHEMHPGLEVQAVGRAQRLGRKGRLEVYRLRYELECANQ
jgi:SNF2 family DNA or RNA helicase